MTSPATPRLDLEALLAAEVAPCDPLIAPSLMVVAMRAGNESLALARLWHSDRRKLFPEHLMQAVVARMPRVVHDLMVWGQVGLQEPPRGSDSPLHFAVRVGDAPIVETLLAQTRNPDLLKKLLAHEATDHMEPLAVAAMRGHRAVAQALFAAGARLQIALFDCIEADSADGLRVLRQLDPERFRGHLDQGLCKAAHQNAPTAGACLLEMGADPAAYSHGMECSALQMAGKHDKPLLFMRLLEAGADPAKLLQRPRPELSAAARAVLDSFRARQAVEDLLRATPLPASQLASVELR